MIPTSVRRREPGQPLSPATTSVRTGANTRLPAPTRWARISRRWRVVIVLAAAVAVADFVLSFAGAVYGTPSRQVLGQGSSLDTSSVGTAALAQLYSDNGHRVRRLETSLGRASLPLPGTLLVLDPQGPLSSEIAAIEGYLGRGARVVLAGPPGTAALRALLGPGPIPAWQAANPGPARAGAPEPENFAAGDVESAAQGSWVLPRGASGRVHRLLVGVKAPLALWARVGAGRLILLASSGPLEDGDLGRADNAAFALDLGGPPGSAVSFDEYDHLRTQSGSGLAGLPGHWRAALALGLLAVIVWILSAARRFGPPMATTREMVPPRVEYVEAMADLLATGPPRRLREAAQPLRAEARELLCRRLRAGPGASDEELVRLASSSTLPEGVVRSVLGGAASEDDLVALGSAYAALLSKRRWS